MQTDALEIAYAKTGETREKNSILSTGWYCTDGQQIYYLEWGTPGGKPFIVLHGGPGASFGPSHVALFDPTQHHVLFFDQRGCGKSMPSAGVLDKVEIEKTNNPTHIVADIEQLRARFFDDVPVHVAGGSWGSTLALLYAIQYPEHVASLQIWSTFLGQQVEIEEMFTDRRTLTNFPHGAAWERFIALVPEPERATGRQVLDYYARMIAADGTAAQHAFEFELYEDTLCAPDDPSTLEADLSADPNLVSWARIEILYHQNNMFLAEGYILGNLDKIKNLKCQVVQGNRDWCTPEKYARELEKGYGPNCTVTVVNSGHMRNDREMQKALRARMLAA